MRHSVGGVGLVALASLALAQDKPCMSLTSKFPDCARSCVEKVASQVGCTNAEDVGCQCTPASSRAILATAQACVIGCGFDQIVPAIAAGKAICSCMASATPSPSEASITSTGVLKTSSETARSTASLPVKTSATWPAWNSSSSSSLLPPTEPPTLSPSEPPKSPTPTLAPSGGAFCSAGSPCQKSADAVPGCAKPCIESAALSAAKCGQGDDACACSSSAVIQKAALGCVMSGCGIAGGAQVLRSVSALCACVTASPTMPCSGRATVTGPTSDAPRSGSSESVPSGTPTSAATATAKPSCETTWPSSVPALTMTRNKTRVATVTSCETPLVESPTMGSSVGTCASAGCASHYSPSSHLPASSAATPCSGRPACASSGQPASSPSARPMTTPCVSGSGVSPRPPVGTETPLIPSSKPPAPQPSPSSGGHDGQTSSPMVPQPTRGPEPSHDSSAVRPQPTPSHSSATPPPPCRGRGACSGDRPSVTPSAEPRSPPCGGGPGCGGGATFTASTALTTRLEPSCGGDHACGGQTPTAIQPLPPVDTTQPPAQTTAPQPLVSGSAGHLQVSFFSVIFGAFWLALLAL